MKNYQHYELGMLKLERDRLTYEISNWEEEDFIEIKKKVEWLNGL